MRRTFLGLIACFVTCRLAADPSVRLMRVPDNGLQPQVAVDSEGVVHLIYLKGEPAHCDIYYTRSSDDGVTFAPAIRVNSEPGSAIALGTIRGAHLAIGRDRRVHVAWNGSSTATPKAPGNAIPMLYARLNDKGDEFSTQRNVIAQHVGLDGGGSIAADREGRVYIAWHAPEHPGEGEASRRVWIRRSTNHGETFGPELQASPDPTGACGCCGLRLFCSEQGSVFCLYRGAQEKIHRDMYLLRSDDHAEHFTSRMIAPFIANQCVMSSSAMAQAQDEMMAVWESNARVYCGRISKTGLELADVIASPAPPPSVQHPALGVNPEGQVLMAWAAGTGWNKGGGIAWSISQRDGKPLATAIGQANGLPAWSMPAVFVTKQNTFVIIY